MSGNYNNDQYVEFLKSLNKTGILPTIDKHNIPSEKQFHVRHVMRGYHINAAATLEAGEKVSREIREARSDFRTNQRSAIKTIMASSVFASALTAASVLSGAFLIASSLDRDSANSDAESSRTCVVDATKTDADVQRQLDVCEQARRGMAASTFLTIEMK